MLHYLIALPHLLDTKTLTYFGIGFALYLIYYWYFSFYIWRQGNNYTKGKRNIGRTIPSFPNGWFNLMPASALKPGQVEYIDRFGLHLALFRGTNRKVYCLDAYCAHMGANLAINGEVKHERCLKCPFHGWMFDGETGNCVMGEKMTPKEAIRYEYCENLGEKGNTKNVFLENNKVEKVSIKKYQVLEQSGFIFVWLHAVEEQRVSEPPYFPLDISETQRKLVHRGFSVNKMKCHVQDIAENGADLLHFIYVHADVIPYLVKGKWNPKWMRASEPNLKDLVKHEREDITEFRHKLIDKYINDKNKDHIGVLTLENNLSILGSPYIPFFSLIAFQVGPGLVYLFMKGLFFEVLFFQHTSSFEKYNHELYHEIYTNGWFPYWLSSIYLRLEAAQVQNDGIIWDNKKFGFKPFFKPDSEVDNKLKEWRIWYGQFYEGCKERDAKDRENDW